MCKGYSLKHFDNLDANNQVGFKNSVVNLSFKVCKVPATDLAFSVGIT